MLFFESCEFGVVGIVLNIDYVWCLVIIDGIYVYL